MYSLIQKRRFFFLLSATVLGAGVLVMLFSTLTTGSPFRLSIDFVGGSIYEIAFTEGEPREADLREVFAAFGDEHVIVQQLGDPSERRWSLRSTIQQAAVSDAIIAELDRLAALDMDLLRRESVSATIGREVTQAAVVAVLVATLVVIAFIVLAFRQVPRALRYGVCAVAAMLHDVLIVASVMSLTGLLLGWEADALFLTALLTIVGFSIQDTIVLFDRIRENVPKYLGEPWETIVNRSILESIHRSLGTQLNAFFIMAAILLFGGETIRHFIFILFVGLLSGTYSSIFTAVPLLVAWEKGELALPGNRATEAGG